MSPADWQLPLPDSISFNTDHGTSVKDVIGSGRPFLDENGNLRVKGTFASTPDAQKVRSLISEGHLRYTSVEFLRGAKNVLVGGAFVTVPANPEAIVLSAKAFSEQVDVIVKAASGGDLALMQAAHDAMVHLSGGAVCAGLSMDGTDGEADGSNSKHAHALALALKMATL